MTGANTASCNRRHHSSCSEVERLSHTQTQRGAPPQPLHKVHYAPLNHRHRRRAGAAFHPESRSSLIPITLAPEVVIAPQRANSMQCVHYAAGPSAGTADECTAGGFDTCTFAYNLTGTSHDSTAGVVTDITVCAVTDPQDGLVANTEAIAVADSDIEGGNRRGNHACDRIGAVGTPTTIAAVTGSTATGWQEEDRCIVCHESEGDAKAQFDSCTYNTVSIYHMFVLSVVGSKLARDAPHVERLHR